MSTVKKSIGGGENARLYVSPAVEVVGIGLQGSVMVGSDVSTQELTYEDFEW